MESANNSSNVARKKIVFFTGAGISAESGIQTFRGHDGLWNGYRIEDVATPQAFQKDPEMVLHFYNERRKNVLSAQPNLAHQLIAQLQEKHETVVITQNVDDLHERAGSKHIIHLHGEIVKGRSSLAHDCYTSVGMEGIELGQLASDGSQLRPHIVWFGEDVPMLDEALKHLNNIDYLVVVGTSLMVYPAASLVPYAEAKELICIDPEIPESIRKTATCFEANASTGMQKWVEEYNLL